MKQFYIFLFLLTNLVASDGSNGNLDKSKHMKQDTVVSLFPAPAQSDVYPDTNIEIVFNVELDEKHLKHNALKVRKIDTPKKEKHAKKMEVEGSTVYKADIKTLSFTPTSFLQPGLYEVELHAIKAVKKHKHHKMKNITYRFSVAQIPPVSLKITPTPIEIKEGSALTLKTAVVYDDGSEQILKNGVEWKSANASVLTVETNATATALKEGETTVTSTYKGLTSKTVQALVYLEIDGHRLPPAPAPAINNSTLLGIDINDNGVRDDVERRIYFHYKRPIDQVYMMQYATQHLEILKDPVAAASSEKVQREWWNLYSCRGYLDEQKNISIADDSVDFMENVYMNTKDRMRAYIKFNEGMGGGSYSIPFHDKDMKAENCDFNITQVMESIK